MRSAPKNSCQIRWKILSNLFEFQEVNDYNIVMNLGLFSLFARKFMLSEIVFKLWGDKLRMPYHTTKLLYIIIHYNH